MRDLIAPKTERDRRDRRINDGVELRRQLGGHCGDESSGDVSGHGKHDVRRALLAARRAHGPIAARHAFDRGHARVQLHRAAETFRHGAR